MIIKGKTADWEVICGLEIHCQIISKSKIFSGASTHYGSDVNQNVSFVDAGMPGMLPTLNEECVRQAVKTGLGLNAKINKYSAFARKNYFYADLPQGYQITQFQYPIVGEGFVKIELEDGSSKNIGIERLHIEQDAAKSIHDISPTKTFIDLNRSGVGLMEIVTKPDFRSPEEAGAFLRKLRSIVRYLGTCDGNMDEGSMRCDASISVRPLGSQELRPRAEVKNVNSVIRSNLPCRQSILRPDAKLSYMNPAAPCNSKPASLIRQPAKLSFCGLRSFLTTTAISPSQICRRWF